MRTATGWTTFAASWRHLRPSAAAEAPKTQAQADNSVTLMPQATQQTALRPEVCPSLGGRPPVIAGSSDLKGVQALNIPKTQASAPAAVRLQRLVDGDTELLAQLNKGAQWISWEQYTEEQARQDAHLQGFGGARPATAHVGLKPQNPWHVAAF
jgi:hypothetical protein